MNIIGNDIYIIERVSNDQIFISRNKNDKETGEFLYIDKDNIEDFKELLSNALELLY